MLRWFVEWPAACTQCRAGCGALAGQEGEVGHSALDQLSLMAKSQHAGIES